VYLGSSTTMVLLLVDGLSSQHDQKLLLFAAHYLLPNTDGVMVYFGSATRTVLLCAMHYLLPNTYWVVVTLAVRPGKYCCLQCIICYQILTGSWVTLAVRPGKCSCVQRIIC
jgi:hypothetical protein